MGLERDIQHLVQHLRKHGVSRKEIKECAQDYGLNHIPGGKSHQFSRNMKRAVAGSAAVIGGLGSGYLAHKYGVDEPSLIALVTGAAAYAGLRREHKERIRNYHDVYPDFYEGLIERFEDRMDKRAFHDEEEHVFSTSVAPQKRGYLGQISDGETERYEKQQVAIDKAISRHSTS